MSEHSIKILCPILPLKKILPSDALQHHISNYNLCAGNMELREEISKRMLGLACSISTRDIITTNGCLEAVTLCLRAVASPGDTILVESPVFHRFLQLIEDLNLYVVEIPGCPEKGMDSNFQNPLGSVISKKINQLSFG